MLFSTHKTLAMSGMAASVAAWDWSNGVNARPSASSTNSCTFFKQNYPNMTTLPTDDRYASENEVSWNAGAWLGPACVLTPLNAEDMSYAVKNLVKFATPFSMRGGGHMPIPDAANINSTGVLISSTNLTTLELSDDQSFVSVGPGKRWGDVYIYLDETRTGKMVVGGRYAPVGIPGYLLGGGMSFFSYDPSIGLASPSYGYGSEVKDQYLTSILNYVINGSSDPKAAIIPTARFGPGYTSPRYDAVLFYNGVNISTPAILSDFQGGALPADNTTSLTSITMGQFSQAVLPAFQKGGESNGLQQNFHVISTKANRQAMDIVHDTFFDAVIAQNLSSLSSFFVGLTWNAITTKFIETSNNGTGCPQGMTEEPVFWVEQSLSWGDSADDAKIDAFIQSVNANMTTQLVAANLTSSYIYLNDADKGQPVFAGYPAENVQRLKDIRDKYDPLMIYTNLMPGGFKVAQA
ncbi:hypothetical protein G7Y89_g11779 [Cudoniella acicularis]|uniref:FAD-binding PCMH-type domain-containing protein n=1 Tax=Cudoniella acicularis TaxID=354080 RepID=A0A8H4RDX1_9HELO|nr:hypothetical protein G7Y89_g11779 [Cudoniella acicularis]